MCLSNSEGQSSPARLVRRPQKPYLPAIQGSPMADIALARIGAMKALYRHEVRRFNPDAKDDHWGKRRFKRDR
jgi:hypothetical protein